MVGLLGDVDEIASGSYLEGLAVDYERNIVWYSDVIGGGIHAVTPDGSVSTFNRDRRWTAGLMINTDGSVLSSGPGGIMWNNASTGRSGWLLDAIDDIPVNGVNEMAPDGTGGIYFGTLDVEMLSQGQPTRASAIYRLTVDREVVEVAAGIGFANGIVLSADRSHLYCNDTFSGTWVFDVCDDFSLVNRRLLAGKEDADGLALDFDGNAWITGFRSSDVSRVGPDGASQAPVRTPAGAVSQVRFGGADMCDCYFTAVPADAGDSLKEGQTIGANGSVLYRGRSTIPGLRIVPTEFTLE